MSFNDSSFDLVTFEERTWRISGFTSDGLELWFEFSGPRCATASVPYRESCRIGRDPEFCQFVINDTTVSRVHAELRFDRDSGILIRDLGSSNGTFIDGARIDEAFQPVNVGAQVKFGEFMMFVSYPR